MVGMCALCLQPNSELQKSHLFPAAAYKRLRDPISSNPNPLWTTHKFAVQTSSQTQDYLLCWTCEQTLRANGEDWVMQNCWHRDGSFPLQEALERATPYQVSSWSRLYHATEIPSIQVDRLAYFGASIFWRASAHNWRTGKTKGSTKGLLGPYENDFREYLLGKQHFPESAALWVAVTQTEDTAITANVLEPMRGRPVASCKVQKFLFLGISFMLYVGKRMDASYRKMCLVNGFGNPIGIQAVLDEAMIYQHRVRAARFPELLS
jgi:hypothetical protein